MTRLFLRRARRALAAAALLLLFLSGCQDRYPDDLHYPLRTDLIFVDAPKGKDAEPFYPRAPGKLDEEMKLINEHGGKTLDPAKVPAEDRQALQAALEDAFGTPAWPMVWHFNKNENTQALAKLRLDEDTLEAGSDLYRRHCLHCHGLTGDGRGPTGPWLSPSPRDYRQGQFKFISVAANYPFRKARRADIRRTLDVGVEGTSMPSFNMLSKEEREQLVSYVLHLSIRGQTEYEILKTLIEENKKALAKGTKGREETVFPDAVRYWVTELLKQWAGSDALNEPGPYPYDDDKDPKALKASIGRGFELFTATGCLECHKDFGRQVAFRYDVWGTLVRPANLTAGVYRGGRRPLDLYWRVTGGIPPSGMPGSKELSEDVKKKVYGGGADPNHWRWDLVNFVRYLPYPQMLPEEVKKKVYGGAHDPKKDSAPDHPAAGEK